MTATHEPAEPIDYISSLLDQKKYDDIEAYLNSVSRSEKSFLISRLDEDERTDVLTNISTEAAADLIEDLFDDQAADLIEELPVVDAAAIVDEMASDEQADLLGHLDRDTAEAILEKMDPEEARDARFLLQSAADTAGGIMITEFLAYPETKFAKNVVSDLRKHGDEYSDYEVQYTYITTDDGKLKGVLPLRQLVLAAKHTPLAELAITKTIHVTVDTSLEELKNIFEHHNFLGIPVTDHDHHLVGIVLRKAVLEAVDEQSGRSFLNFSGIVGGEELRSMPLLSRSFRRLSWLSVNIVLNIIAASVIAFYQETLAAVIALAVFLPIISDMSGCSGNQAVAVSIRELSLGQVKPHELLRVLYKEAGIGIINGLVLGALIGTFALLWGNAYLGLVVGTALALNSILAVCLGGLIPLFLRGMNMDPALASSPILTTVTDMCGFFLVLNFATMALPMLT